MFHDELRQLQIELGMSNGAVLAIAREIAQAESGYEDMRSIDLLTGWEREELLRTLHLLTSCCAIC